MARFRKKVNWYGLTKLGYDLGETGDWLRDQLMVESIAFRIGHRPEEGGLGKFEHFRNAVDLVYNEPSRRCHKRFIWHDWAVEAISAFCDELEIGLAGSASSGKTAPAALWGTMNFIMDPTHVKVLTLSTTIKEAKDRIWKEVMEFYEAIPNAPGKPQKSQNQILGPTLSGNGFGTSSGIYLSAADKSNESKAVNSMIGTKVVKTGEPGDSPEELLNLPEYRDLKNLGLDEDSLYELVKGLQEVGEDRLGKLIVIVDEATGVTEKVLDAYLSNLKPGNAGRVQMIVIGNPSSKFDMHGIFCEPAAGWDAVNINMDKWRTVTGGVCLHFDGEKNPRIITKNDKLVWMPTEKDNEATEKKYGRESYEYYRMVRGYWAPTGMLDSVYTEADFTQSRALHDPNDPVIWGFQAPKLLAGFDPSFTSGGDAARLRFGKLGITADRRQVLEILPEGVTIKADISNTKTPVPDQLALKFKQECEKRGIPPSNVSFDASGGGVAFAAIVQRLWSPEVRKVESGGKASAEPIPGEKTMDKKPIRGTDKFANRATELWCAALPFLRTGQIKGIPRELAKEICSRQKAKKKGVSNLDKVQIERKTEYKDREKMSPDDADAFFVLLDEAKARHGFRPGEPIPPKKHDPYEDYPTHGSGSDTWEKFKERARRITRRNSLKSVGGISKVRRLR